MSLSKQFARAVHEWADVFMSRSIRETMQFCKNSRLTMPQISTLMRLSYHGPCGVSEVGSHLGVTNAAASQMVDKLVQQGYLERAEDPNDRRAKQLTLTPKGRALIQESLEARRRWLEKLITALTPERQKAIITALPYLTEAARKLEPEREQEVRK
ncbi:MAG: MarR family winged helix-turn-helix transcriptional regulator [Anaerolineales bacterium]